MSKLGDGDTTARCMPTMVCGSLKWKAMTPSHGITTDGDLYAWGGGNPTYMFDPRNIGADDIQRDFEMCFVDFLQKFFKRLDQMGHRNPETWIPILNKQFRQYGLTFSGVSQDASTYNLVLGDMYKNCVTFAGRYRGVEIDFTLNDASFQVHIEQPKQERTKNKQAMLVDFQKTFSKCLRGVARPEILEVDFMGDLEKV